MTDHIEVLQGMLDHYGDNPLHFTLEKASLRAAIAALRAQPSEPQVNPDNAGGLATRLRELIGEYWDIAYAEGYEKSTTDTPKGDAARVSLEIEQIIRELCRAAPAGVPVAQSREVGP